MHEIKIKPFFAALVSAIIFCLLWWFAKLDGYVTFKNWEATRAFLVINVLLWLMPIFLESITEEFSFKEHGFQLAVTALTSTIALGSAADMRKYSISPYFIALGVVVLSLCILLYVRHSKNARENRLTAAHRFFSYIEGVVAAQTFILASIYEDIVTCYFW